MPDSTILANPGTIVLTGEQPFIGTVSDAAELALNGDSPWLEIGMLPLDGQLLAVGSQPASGVQIRAQHGELRTTGDRVAVARVCVLDPTDGELRIIRDAVDVVHVLVATPAGGVLLLAGFNAVARLLGESVASDAMLVIEGDSPTMSVGDGRPQWRRPFARFAARQPEAAFNQRAGVVQR